MRPHDRTRLPAAALAGLLAAACLSAPRHDTPAEAGAAPEPATPQQPIQPVLYARDGTPVTAPVQAAAQEPADTASGRDLVGDAGGHMYILELYQDVIDERDALSLEVDTLTDELNRRGQALASAHARIAELEARAAQAEGENRELRQENAELTGRLTTAQIRRLQAEKILLEQRLAELGAPAGDSGDDGAQVP